MRFQFGPDEGNSGAIFRFGSDLGKGIWVRGWNFRRLWTSWRFRKDYTSFGIICFHL